VLNYDNTMTQAGTTATLHFKWKAEANVTDHFVFAWFSSPDFTDADRFILYQNGLTSLKFAYGTGGTATVPTETLTSWSTSMFNKFVNVFVVISSEGLRLVMHKENETVYNNLWAINMSSFLSNHNEFRMTGKTGSIVDKARACTMAMAGWYNYVMTDAQMLAASTY
jgi:hypothetical protein